MQYNLYISYKNGNYNLFGVSEQQLQKIIGAYLHGDKEVTIRGSRHIIDGTRSLRIFQHDVNSTPEESSAYYLGNINYREKGFAHYYLPPETLLKMGKEVTENFIQDREYGELRIEMNYKTEQPVAQMKNKSQEQEIREQFIKSSYEAANSAPSNPPQETIIKKQLPFGASAELFWGIFIAIVGCAFTLGLYFGSNKFDRNLIELSDIKRALEDTIRIREITINHIRHNSDSALNILSHMPYDEMKLDTLSWRKVQTTIEDAGAILYLNK